MLIFVYLTLLISVLDLRSVSNSNIFIRVAEILFLNKEKVWFALLKTRN